MFKHDVSLCKQISQHVRDAGRVLRMAKIKEVRYKTDHQNLISEFDYQIQTMLESVCYKLLPEAAFYSEEKKNTKIAGLTWILDPIDGTTNFVSMAKDYAISLALYDGCNPLIGIVYDVVGDEMFTAVVNQGAYCNQNCLPSLDAVEINNAILDSSLMSLTKLNEKALKPIYEITKSIRAHRCLGSAAISIAQIAKGNRQIYLSSKLYPWDYAAAYLILREVGGILSPVFLEDDLFKDEPTPIIATSDIGLYHHLLSFFR